MSETIHATNARLTMQKLGGRLNMTATTRPIQTAARPIAVPSATTAAAGR